MFLPENAVFIKFLSTVRYGTRYLLKLKRPLGYCLKTPRGVLRENLAP
jgi:hypothetical protein